MRNFGLGIKNRRKAVNQIGQKLHQAERLGQKTGRAIDIASRKTKNTTHKIGNFLEDSQKYSDGIAGLSTANALAKDVARGVEAAARGARKGGQMLEKESSKGLADKIENRLRDFV